MLSSQRSGKLQRKIWDVLWGNCINGLDGGIKHGIYSFAASTPDHKFLRDTTVFITNLPSSLSLSSPQASAKNSLPPLPHGLCSVGSLSSPGPLGSYCDSMVLWDCSTQHLSVVTLIACWVCLFLLLEVPEVGTYTCLACICLHCLA